jgi:hypothetical protein
MTPGSNNHKTKAAIMKYALLFHETTEHFARRGEPGFMEAWMAYINAIHASGIFVSGAGLLPPESGTLVSVRDGKRRVHDGPYAETKEFLGGLVVIDAPNLDVALEWAARSPAAGYSAVEVRPLLPGEGATEICAKTATA